MICGKGNNIRAAIFSHPNVNCVPVQKLCNEDCAVGLISTKDGNIIVASIYLDINLDVYPLWLDEVCRYAYSKKYGIIIGADSNAHSLLFGPDSNRRGDAFDEFIVNNGLMVENVGLVPTFQARRQNCSVATFIDVTLTRGLKGNITGWRVDPGFNGSDHNTFCLLYTSPSPRD